MLITILYTIWITYTVGSISLIGVFLTFSFFAKKEEKKNNERLRNLIKARPEDY